MLPKFSLLPAFCGGAYAAVYNVQVGNGGLVFKPETISAAAGDTVVFELFANHDVVQGDFASPCTPSGEGFYSGPYSGTDQGRLRFVVNVTDSNPVYYYCSVSRHCQSGMVGGINLPSSGNTFASYQNAARSVAGQAVTPTDRRGGQLRSADQLGNSTSSSSSSAASSSPSPTQSARSSVSAGASASASAASATPSRGAAVDVTLGQVSGATGFVALIVGIAAWFL